MAINEQAYRDIIRELGQNTRLVAVSKTKPVEDIKDLYDLGQRDFGENYVQEMVEKASMLPKDIRWHFIGHLQTNKVKLIAPFVQLIHGVDSLKLLKEVDKQAAKSGRVIDCLLQIHIATEETKFGLDEKELEEVIHSKNDLKNVRVIGLMGMASFSDDMALVRSEFRKLKDLLDKHAELRTSDSGLPTLSMGMSSDYRIAMEEGSNMVRIGSLLFGQRGR